jgi:hypothetical protein
VEIWIAFKCGVQILYQTAVAHGWVCLHAWVPVCVCVCVCVWVCGCVGVCVGEYAAILQGCLIADLKSTLFHTGRTKSVPFRYFVVFRLPLFRPLSYNFHGLKYHLQGLLQLGHHIRMAGPNRINFWLVYMIWGRNITFNCHLTWVMTQSTSDAIKNWNNLNEVNPPTYLEREQSWSSRWKHGFKEKFDWNPKHHFSSQRSLEPFWTPIHFIFCTLTQKARHFFVA